MMPSRETLIRAAEIIDDMAAWYLVETPTHMMPAAKKHAMEYHAEMLAIAAELRRAAG
jgi:hypothetical protein